MPSLPQYDCLRLVDQRNDFRFLLTDQTSQPSLKEPEPGSDQRKAAELHQGVWQQMRLVGGYEQYDDAG